MASRIDEYHEMQLKQIGWFEYNIRFFSLEEPNCYLMPIIAKGNKYQGIEALE